MEFKIKKAAPLNMKIAGSGGSGSGTDDYNALLNRPSINGYLLTGNKSAADIGIIIPVAVTRTSQLTNDNYYIADTNYTHTDNNFSATYKAKLDGLTNFSGSYADLTNKPVIPTATSQLTNDNAFVTDAAVTAKIRAALSSAYIYKGTVANKAALPATANNAVGDVYNLKDSGMNVAWTADGWDDMAPTVDLSDYSTHGYVTDQLLAYVKSAELPTAVSAFTNDAGYITAAQIPAGGAHVLEWDVTIGTSWTAAGSNFTQDITGMTGMAATYSAEADMVAADAYDAAADEAFNKIYKMTTIDGGLRVFAREALTVTIPLHVKAVY